MANHQCLFHVSIVEGVRNVSAMFSLCANIGGMFVEEHRFQVTIAHLSLVWLKVNRLRR